MSRASKKGLSVDVEVERGVGRLGPLLLAEVGDEVARLLLELLDASESRMPWPLRVTFEAPRLVCSACVAERLADALEPLLALGAAAFGSGSSGRMRGPSLMRESSAALRASIFGASSCSTSWFTRSCNAASEVCPGRAGDREREGDQNDSFHYTAPRRK